MVIPSVVPAKIACDLKGRTHKNNLLAAALRPVQRGGVLEASLLRIGGNGGFMIPQSSRFWIVHFAK
jgi:hypothetical protein